MAQRIIAIAGKKRSGKGTLTKYLQELHPYVETSFAGALWRCMLAMDPWVSTEDHQKYGTLFVRLSALNEDYGYEYCKANFPDVREYMKRLGSEGVRDNVSKTTWLDVVIREIKSNPDKDFIVSDCRFENEGLAVHNLGGVVVKLERSLGHEDTHSSENEISKIFEDFSFDNSGELKDLEKFAKHINGQFPKM